METAKYRVTWRGEVIVYITNGMFKVDDLNKDIDMLVAAAEALGGSHISRPYLEACGHGLIRLAVIVSNVPKENIPKGAKYA